MPWQNYPEKFVQYANKFENTKDDFERLIGYLLLDVGVEALLKAFVLADTSLKYPERESSAKGMVGKDMIPDSKITAVNFDKITFHNLLVTVQRVVTSKVTDEELQKAEHYHGIRNIIYHEGRKTIPSAQDFKDYLALAKSLLYKLSGAVQKNHEQETNSIPNVIGNAENNEQVSSQTPYAMDKDEYFFLTSVDNPESTFNDLIHDITVASVLVRPKYETTGFKESLWKLSSEIDALGSIPFDSSIYHTVETEIIQKFRYLTDTKTDNIEFIKTVCSDITYLKLAVLLSKLHEDVFDELGKYKKFRGFASRRLPEYDEITQEYIAELQSFRDWVYQTQGKISSWFEQNIVNN